jgi:hypothetical protein
MYAKRFLMTTYVLLCATALNSHATEFISDEFDDGNVYV